MQFLSARSRGGRERTGAAGSRQPLAGSRTRSGESASSAACRVQCARLQQLTGDPGAQRPSSRCQLQEAAALLCSENSSGSDLSKRRARRRRTARDPRNKGAGSGAAARERGAQTGRGWGRVMSQRAGRLNAAAATRYICRPSCCPRSGPRPWRR